jgi:hypothetical protein
MSNTLALDTSYVPEFDENVLNYAPPKTVQEFMLDNTSLVKVIVGPLGSGKSMGCIMEMLRRSREQKPDRKGVRRTRWAIVRNTAQQLRQTVLADINEHLGAITKFYVTDSTVQIRISLPDGTTMNADWMLIPLDTPQDVKRLLSMQLTGAWINEIREVPFNIVDGLLGRIGRYPSALHGGPSWCGLIADTNPWDTDSPYHDALVLNKIKKWSLYHQPSGIGPLAENAENLRPGYYEDLITGRNEDWASVHVESEFGSSNAGQAVFRRSFNAAIHVHDGDLQVNPMRPLMVAMDFGRTPTALICQTDVLGRLIVFKEIVTVDCGLYMMVREYLMPVLKSPPFAGLKVFIVADPAGGAKDSLGEESAFDALGNCGLKAHKASTNDISPRLRAVEKIMRENIQGSPALFISRSGCPTLVMALGNKYRYKKKKDGQLEENPEKLHPWSDVADCLQYAALGAQVNITGRVIAKEARRQHGGRVMPAGAWT